MNRTLLVLAAPLVASGCSAAKMTPLQTAPREASSLTIFVETPRGVFEDAECRADAQAALAASIHGRMRSALQQAGLRIASHPGAPHDAVLRPSYVVPDCWGSDGTVKENLGVTSYGYELISRDGIVIATGASRAKACGDMGCIEDPPAFANAVTSSPSLVAFARDQAARASRQPAVAQTTPATVPAPPVVTPPAAATAPAVAISALVPGAPQPHAFALVIGIETYRDAPAAPGARSDAQRFVELVTTSLGLRRENVRVAIDERATRSDVERELVWLKNNVPANGRVYFFFSGHGAPDASAGTPYVLPYDGDPRFVGTTAIPLGDVLARLGETKASEVVAFVDSCFSGAGGRSVLPPGARPLVKMVDPKAPIRVTLLSASSGAEISGPAADGTSGVFSKFVAQGLGQGLADIDGDGSITARELTDWIRPRVAREAKRDGRDQTPALVTGSGADVVLMSGLPSH